MSSLKTAILYTLRLTMLQQTDFECCRQNQYNSLQQRLPAVLTLMRPPVVLTHPHLQAHTRQSQLYTHTQIQQLKQEHDCFYSYIQSHKDTLRAPRGFWDPEVCNLTGITVLRITLPDSIKMKKTHTHKTQTYFPSQANNKLI